MKRTFLPALLLAALAVLRADAQVMPLASGNRWSYTSSDRGDTLQVSLARSEPLQLSCDRSKRKLPAWRSSDHLSYVNVPGGVVLAERHAAGEGDSTIHPLFFLPNILKKGAVPPTPGDDCFGGYHFIGFATVTTPAGVFEQALIFDDRNVHRVYIAPGVGIVREERYKGSESDNGVAAERSVLWSRVLVDYLIGGRGPR